MLSRHDIILTLCLAQTLIAILETNGCKLSVRKKTTTINNQQTPLKRISDCAVYQRRFNIVIQSCCLGIVWEKKLLVCTTTSINKAGCSYVKNVAVGRKDCYHPSTIVSLRFFWEKGGERKREGLKKAKHTIHCCSANWTQPLSRLSCHFQFHLVGTRVVGFG